MRRRKKLRRTKAGFARDAFGGVAFAFATFFAEVIVVTGLAAPPTS